MLVVGVGVSIAVVAVVVVGVVVVGVGVGVTFGVGVGVGVGVVVGVGVGVDVVVGVGVGVDVGVGVGVGVDVVVGVGIDVDVSAVSLTPTHRRNWVRGHRTVPTLEWINTSGKNKAKQYAYVTEVYDRERLIPFFKNGCSCTAVFRSQILSTLQDKREL